MLGKLLFGFCVSINIAQFINGQTTALKSCEAHETDTATGCFINYVSDKFEQLSAKLDLVRSRAPQPSGATICTATTSVNATFPQNCADILALGHNQSGIYKIYNPERQFSPFRSSSEIDVYCDMDTDRGGWLVFQRRCDGSVDFYRNWNTYRDGFGILSGEFWWGNENLALISRSGRTFELRIDLGDWSGETRYARYTSFRVRGEENNFQLNLGSYIGDAGDGLNTQRNRYFSTAERDQDSHSGHNCALKNYRAGFWYSNCGAAYLNSQYIHSNGSEVTPYKGIHWLPWRGNNYSLKNVEMKMRPVT